MLLFMSRRDDDDDDNEKEEMAMAKKIFAEVHIEGVWFCLFMCADANVYVPKLTRI